VTLCTPSLGVATLNCGGCVESEDRLDSAQFPFGGTPRKLISDRSYEKAAELIDSLPESIERRSGRPRHNAWPFVRFTVPRIGSKFYAALSPPRVNLGFIGKYCADLFMDLPVYGEAFLLFPPLNGAHFSVEIRSDLFPGVQEVVRPCLSGRFR